MTTATPDPVVPPTSGAGVTGDGAEPAPQPGRGLLREERDVLAAQVRAGQLQPALFPERFVAVVDGWLADQFDQATGGENKNVALLAVGGHGRGQLCPGSDLDLVLVHKGRRDVKKVADRIWYALWDQGVRLDHSVRTPKEALAVATDDLPAMLGLLDGRLVAGDERLSGPLLEEVRSTWQTHARRCLPELAALCEARLGLFGEVPFLLEPDLKESRGGLRDVVALRAAARAAPALGGLLSPVGLEQAEHLLLATRCALHSFTGSHDDRLLLQEQDRVAPLLGYYDADELMAAVAAAGREVLWTSDGAWRRARSWSEGPIRRAGGHDVEIAPGIVRRDGEIAVTSSTEVSGDPGVLLRAALAAASEGRHLEPATLARLVEEAPAPPDPWPDELRRSFLALLALGDGAIPVIEALDQRHLFERLVPEWTAVRNRPQRNAFHRYTVDRHLLEAVARAADLIREVARPDLLLLGALLHDIGKGSPGDHSSAGSSIAQSVARRLGYSPGDVVTLARVVALHLLLPETATRRDLDDPRTVETVAAKVVDHVTLELLGALAEADGLATGSAAWGPWKAGLVAELVSRADRLLAGEEPAPRAGAPEPALLGSVPGHEVSVVADGDEVTVVAPDRPGLLSLVTGTLALHGIAILEAQAHGARDGLAVEMFKVATSPSRPPEWQAVESDLVSALEGTLLLDARLASLEAAYAPARRRASAAAPSVKVLVDNDASAGATVIEVRAHDRHGLLHALTRALATSGLDVVSARVATLGHEVVDSFYVRDEVGGKLTDPTAIEAVGAALEDAALEGGTR